MSSALPSFALLATRVSCVCSDTGWRDTAGHWAVFKYWAQCARLCDRARQVPAVFAEQWMVPIFSSSTELWILPLCNRDRYAQCQTVHFWTGVDMPVVVHVNVVDNPVMAQRPFPMVQFSRPLRFLSCIPLIRCSMSPLRRFSSFPRVQAVRNWSRSHSRTRRIRAWTRSFTRPLCATTDARMVQSAQNCEGPAVAVLRQGGRCPCCAGRRVAAGTCLQLLTSL